MQLHFLKSMEIVGSPALIIDSGYTKQPKYLSSGFNIYFTFIGSELVSTNFINESAAYYSNWNLTKINSVCC